MAPPGSPACQGRPRRGMNWSRPAVTHAIPDTNLLVPQDHPPTRRGGRSRVSTAASGRGQLRLNGVIDVPVDVVVADAPEDAVTR
jgi:hypothetical protein